jgi:biopolymer transport protein ExbB/TolQ
MSEVTVANASILLRELSQPQDRGESIKDIIDRTARAAKLAYWRTFDLWYEKARRVEPEEYELIAEALRIKNERAAKNELHELKFRLARLEALVSGDADFHSPTIDFARDTLRKAGR